MATRLYIVHEGWVTYPTRRTIKCGGSPTQGPSPDHCGATPMTAWVTSLSVGLVGFDFQFDRLMSHTSVGHKCRRVRV
jgi:hypothetical protein